MWSFAGGRGKEKLEPDDDVPENERVNTGKIHSVFSLSHHSLKKVSGEEASLLNTSYWPMGSIKKVCPITPSRRLDWRDCSTNGTAVYDSGNPKCTLHFTEVAHQVEPVLTPGLLSYAQPIETTVRFGAVSLMVSRTSRGHRWPKRSFYFHRGDWCLRGKGPGRDQGTALSGTGHPFHIANTSTVMILWGANQLNELRPTWLLRRENEEKKGVGDKKDGDGWTAR